MNSGIIVEINCNKKDILSTFSTKKPMISSGLIDFIDHQITFLDNENYILDFKCNNIKRSEEQVYQEALHNTYTRLYQNAQKDSKYLFITAIIMFLIGVVILGLALLFEYLKINILLLEVYDIIAWVFVWDSVHILVFKRTKVNRMKRKYHLLKDIPIIFSYNIDKKWEIN